MSNMLKLVKETVNMKMEHHMLQYINYWKSDAHLCVRMFVYVQRLSHGFKTECMLPIFSINLSA